MAIFEIAKKGIWSKKIFVKLIYLISRVFFVLDFFNFSGPLCNWISGPPLPHKCFRPTMIPTPDGEGVILLGCDEESDIKYETENIYRLMWKGSELEWVIMNQKLKYPRWNLVAMLIPDELTNCNYKD